MARLLYPQDSTFRHKRMAWRHNRLCAQVPGAARFGEAIQPTIDTLEQKEAETEEAEKTCESIHDKLTLNKTIFDNQIRNIYDHARRYDRDNLKTITDLLFPEFTLSDLIRLPVREKVRKVMQIVEKIVAFGAEHPLRPSSDTLTASIDNIYSILDTLRNAEDTLSKRQADEEIARNEVRKQYEINYLEARKFFGRQKAEILFPKITSKSSRATKNRIETVDDKETL